MNNDTQPAHRAKRRTLGLFPSMVLWAASIVFISGGTIAGAMFLWNRNQVRAQNQHLSELYANLWCELESQWASSVELNASDLLSEPGLVDALEKSDGSQLLSTFSTRYNHCAVESHLADWLILGLDGVPWLSFANPSQQFETTVLHVDGEPITAFTGVHLTRDRSGAPVWVTPLTGSNDQPIGWMVVFGEVEFIANQFQTLAGVSVAIESREGDLISYTPELESLFHDSAKREQPLTCIALPTAPSQYFHVRRVTVDKGLTIQVASDATTEHNLASASSWLPAAVSLGVAVFLSVGLLTLRQRLRPIHELCKAMTAAESAENFDVRMPVRRRDEIGRMTEAFNALVEKLGLRNAALAAHSVELEAARLAAETSSRAKSEFLANMSHEIRTPMNAVIGYTELLLDPNQTTDQRTQCVHTIRRNGEHLLTLINDILDLSKIEAGRLTIENLDCSPARIAREVESLMRARSNEKSITLDVEFRGSIPQTIRTDPTRLRQILVNLVANAIKFTHDGSVRILVSYLPPNHVRFEVVDTGIGISTDQLESIFEAFGQADNSVTRRYGGTGLGLAISQRLAHALGGKIEVTSIEGQGSIFTFTIATGDLSGVPMIDADRLAQVITQDPEDESANTASVDLHGARILLAEDGPDNQRLIAFHLNKAGAEVDIAENGSIAVEKAIASREMGRPFDLILMDMQMPVQDGYSTTRELRHRNWTGPIIALTAHAMRGDREKCINAGCDDYATKPIDRIKLLHLCADRIDRARDAA